MHATLQSILKRQRELQLAEDARSAEPPAPTEPPAPAPSALPVSSSYGVVAEAGDPAAFLNFQFPNGDRTAFPYAALIFVSYNWDQSRLDLDFGSYSVSVSGRDIAPALYDLILGRRVEWISEPWPSHAPITGTPWVERIDIMTQESAPRVETARNG